MTQLVLKKPCKHAGTKISVTGYCGNAHVKACHKAHGPRPSQRHTAGHLCSNRWCVEPSHLEWQTYSTQNLKENQKRSKPVLRSKVLRKKILKEFLTGSATSYEIANKYGVPANLLRQWATGYRHADTLREVEAEIIALNQAVAAKVVATVSARV